MRASAAGAAPAAAYWGVPIVPLHGHTALATRLLEAARGGRLPASLLLHGPAGVGKQRLALWLARALLCTGARDGVERPCGDCQSCRYADELQHPDLHWYFPRENWTGGPPDAERVRRDYAEAVAERVKAGGLYPEPDPAHALYVAAVRALVGTAALSPALSRRKVLVVGDAERMVAQEGADQAANAFLKLLEEPPADTTILLTSSEPGALLPTIRSRVVAVRVPRLPDADVAAFCEDPLVRAALDEARGPARLDDRLALAAGAPGRLLGSRAVAAATAAANRLLDAATGRRSQLYREAFSQGVAGARGQFSANLEALTAALHERTRLALRRGDSTAAYRYTLAVPIVETARERAFGNASPQLVSAALLRQLAEVLR